VNARLEGPAGLQLTLFSDLTATSCPRKRLTWSAPPCASSPTSPPSVIC
jgi:hypothetical protein